MNTAKDLWCYSTILLLSTQIRMEGFKPVMVQFCTCHTVQMELLYFMVVELHHTPTYHRYSNLIHVDVGVRGYDRTSSIVHSLPHHVLTKQTLLLLQDL